MIDGVAADGVLAAGNTRGISGRRVEHLGPNSAEPPELLVAQGISLPEATESIEESVDRVLGSPGA
ncbi:hypothetical protein [Nocardia sp. NPDC050710]|uniref:hypothetical protein n=1 Tax=Nocardia sp. NPDC050710 TaxID=3157220 RepID=UPI0033FAEDA2